MTVILEMPGVDKEKVDVNVENDILTIEGRIDYSGSSWNRVGDFWVENATKLGIAREFCILRDLEFEHD